MYRLLISCIGSTRSGKRNSKQTHVRFESTDGYQSYIPPRYSSDGAVGSPPETSIPLPYDQPRPFEQSQFRTKHEQPERRTNKSNNMDFKPSYNSHSDQHDEEATFQHFPRKAGNQSRRIQQELHRQKLAATLIRLERAQLKRERDKLRREQDELLRSQRRLRHGWRTLQEEKQRRASHYQSDSFQSSSEHSEADNEDQPTPRAERSRHTDWTGNRDRASEPFPETVNDAKALLDKYNAQWHALQTGTTTSIPWPTPDLTAPALTNPVPLPSNIPSSSQTLITYNAFAFFTSAFGLQASIKPSNSNIILDIIGDTSVELTKAIRKQATEDLKRWHQDKLGARGGGLVGDERAKAVFVAVLRIYEICTGRLRGA